MNTVKILQKARAKLAENRASLASKIIRWFSRKSLRWLERQIGQVFDRKLSLKIDKEKKSAIINFGTDEIQLEKGKIRSPSPSVLHKLSELYDVSYASLLELAGYPVPENSQPTSVTQSSFSLRMGTVTADEEEALLEYLEFMRSKRKKKRK